MLSPNVLMVNAKSSIPGWAVHPELSRRDTCQGQRKRRQPLPAEIWPQCSRRQRPQSPAVSHSGQKGRRGSMDQVQEWEATWISNRMESHWVILPAEGVAANVSTAIPDSPGELPQNAPGWQSAEVSSPVHLNSVQSEWSLHMGTLWLL